MTEYYAAVAVTYIPLGPVSLAQGRRDWLEQSAGSWLQQLIKDAGMLGDLRLDSSGQLKTAVGWDTSLD